MQEKLASQQQKSSTILDTPQLKDTAKQTGLNQAQTINTDTGFKSNTDLNPTKTSFGRIVSNSNNAEKLKRGLTNFMNSLNPAPYFVPNTIGQQQVLINPLKVSGTSGGLQSSAETAALINVDPTAEVIIKGPTRQTRPIGGPLRWGRRR